MTLFGTLNQDSPKECQLVIFVWPLQYYCLVILFKELKKWMDIANISFFCSTTYDNLQNRYLFPAVNKVYSTHRELHFANAQEQPELHLLGDGRCDSPGYNAKYGTYTLMNSETGEIMDFHVAHVAVAGNSARMELAGFKRLIEFFESNDPNYRFTDNRSS